MGSINKFYHILSYALVNLATLTIDVSIPNLDGNA